MPKTLRRLVGALALALTLGVATTAAVTTVQAAAPVHSVVAAKPAAAGLQNYSRCWDYRAMGKVNFTTYGVQSWTNVGWTNGTVYYNYYHNGSGTHAFSAYGPTGVQVSYLYQQDANLNLIAYVGAGSIPFLSFC